MPENKEARALPCGLLVDRSVNAWIHKYDPADVLAVSIRLNSRDCDVPLEYKIRAHGVADPKLRALVSTAGDSGRIGANDLKQVFVQFPKCCYPGIRLSIQVSDAIYPIRVNFDERVCTPEKPTPEFAIGNATPLRSLLSGHPTPMKFLLSKVAQNRLGSPAPPDPKLLTPDGSTTTDAKTSASASYTPIPENPLPGVTAQELGQLERLLNNLPYVTEEDVWSLVYFSIMDMFVSMGRHSRDWFMQGGPEELDASHETGPECDADLTLEHMAVLAMIETLGAAQSQQREKETLDVIDELDESAPKAQFW
ncbi:unnamed protein product, partial [Mesorhabditis spiculigera]